MCRISGPRRRVEEPSKRTLVSVVRGPLVLLLLLLLLLLLVSPPVVLLAFLACCCACCCCTASVRALACRFALASGLAAYLPMSQDVIKDPGDVGALDGWEVGGEESGDQDAEGVVVDEASEEVDVVLCVAWKETNVG